MENGIAQLREQLAPGNELRENVPLSGYTTLMAGGPARWLIEVRDVDSLASIAGKAQQLGLKTSFIGSGSNLLPSDKGIPWLVVVNACKKIEIENRYAECGCWFQDLFLRAARGGFCGFEFAVGIPGTLGGALVSNAGAYRANIADRLEAIELVETGQRRWVETEYLQFSYRDSILRKPDPPAIALLAVRLRLERGDPKHIYDAARDYQRQRIGKQPPHASAGSFFKNVVSAEIAAQITDLPEKLRESSVIPAGFLIEACGLKGARIGMAKISELHANFICNLGGAGACDLRKLAEKAKLAVLERFGVNLEEEVLYIGDWDAAE